MSILRTVKASFTGGVFSPAMGARVNLDKYAAGLSVATNVFIHAHGGVSNRAGFELVSFTRQTGLSTQIPFVADIEADETYALIFSDQRIMFTRDGVPIYETPISGITHAPSGADALFTKTAHGLLQDDFVLWEDATNPDLHLRVFEVQLVSPNTFKLETMQGAILADADIPGSSFTLARRYTVATPYAAADIRNISYTQDNDVMFLAHELYAPRKLARFGDTNWTLTLAVFAPTMATPTGLGVVEAPSSGATTIDYKVAAISGVGEEGLPSTSVTATNDLSISGNLNTLSWTATAGADRYAVYKDTGGIYGFIGATRNTSFVDDNIVEDTADAPQEAYNPFSGAGNYPRCTALHEQRLFFASTLNDPQSVWGSKTSILENFSSASPAKPDDAINFRVRSRQRESIYSMVSTAAGLSLFTSTTEWMVTGGSEEYLTPTNPVARPQTRRGSRSLPPLLVGDVVMYAQARGGVIRDFVYEYSSNTFNGRDLTLLSRQLFEQHSIISWCYAQSPYSIIWAVRDDGVLLSLTYMREHDIWGWTQHATAGLVDSVISLPEGDEDVVYITSRRTIDTVEYRFHERMASRRITDFASWFFVDCGLTYSGAATDTISGLHHLDGELVSILADGNVHTSLVVTDGSITLDNEYSDVSVGLPYQAEVATLNIDLGSMQEIGTIQGREVSIPQVIAEVEETRGLWAGHDPGYMNEHRQRRLEDYGTATSSVTGPVEIDTNSSYTKGGKVYLQERDPLPLTILSVLPNVSVGG